MNGECNRLTINSGDLRLPEDYVNHKSPRVYILPPAGAALVNNRLFDKIIFLSERPPLIDEEEAMNEESVLNETTYR